MTSSSLSRFWSQVPRLWNPGNDTMSQNSVGSALGSNVALFKFNLVTDCYICPVVFNIGVTGSIHYSINYPLVYYKEIKCYTIVNDNSNKCI